MEYKVSELANLAGVTPRALRYYDRIGLLKPLYVDENGYRFYGKQEVDKLQQILLFRELEVPLDEIRIILGSDDFDRDSSLKRHLKELYNKKDRVDILIKNVEKTIAVMKGEAEMSDKEKFKGFTKEMIIQNEKKYGKEVREKYGDEVVDSSNEALTGMSKYDYMKLNRITEEFNKTLIEAVETGDPSGTIAQMACSLHKDWLGFFWADYNKDAHLGLSEMYVADERFKKHYDSIVPGGAEFLRDALAVFCS